MFVCVSYQLLIIYRTGDKVEERRGTLQYSSITSCCDYIIIIRCPLLTVRWHAVSLKLNHKKLLLC